MKFLSRKEVEVGAKTKSKEPVKKRTMFEIH